MPEYCAGVLCGTGRSSTFMSDSAFALELLTPCLHILLITPQTVLSATSLCSYASV